MNFELFQGRAGHSRHYKSMLLLAQLGNGMYLQVTEFLAGATLNRVAMFEGLGWVSFRTLTSHLFRERNMHYKIIVPHQQDSATHTFPHRPRLKDLTLRPARQAASIAGPASPKSFAPAASSPGATFFSPLILVCTRYQLPLSLSSMISLPQ